MKSLIRNEKNDIEIRDMPEPKRSRPDDVMIKVKSAAVCTTDLAIISGAFGGETPRILGHEVAGEVVQVSSEVKNLIPGHRVALQPTIFCNQCDPCKEGNWHLCPNRRFVGLDVDGGFAEAMVVPAINLIRVPDSVPFEQACLVEPLACVIHALDQLGIEPKKGVIITGAGFSAYIFVQMLISRGLAPEKILVSGRRPKRLELIRQLGAHVLDVREEDLADRARTVFGKSGPDVMIDQTGDPALLRQSMDILARKGTLFIYDFLGHEIPFDFGVMQLREITIKTSTGCPGALERAVEAMARKQVDLEPAITHVFPPAQMKEAFDILRTKDPTHLKSVITF